MNYVLEEYNNIGNNAFIIYNELNRNNTTNISVVIATTNKKQK